MYQNKMLANDSFKTNEANNFIFRIESIHFFLLESTRSGFVTSYQFIPCSRQNKSALRINVSHARPT